MWCQIESKALSETDQIHIDEKSLTEDFLGFAIDFGSHTNLCCLRYAEHNGPFHRNRVKMKVKKSSLPVAGYQR